MICKSVFVNLVEKKTIHFVQEGPFGKFVNCQECGSAIKPKEQDNTVETDKTEQ